MRKAGSVFSLEQMLIIFETSSKVIYLDLLLSRRRGNGYGANSSRYAPLEMGAG